MSVIVKHTVTVECEDYDEDRNIRQLLKEAAMRVDNLRGKATALRLTETTNPRYGTRRLTITARVKDDKAIVPHVR